MADASWMDALPDAAPTSAMQAAGYKPTAPAAPASPSDMDESAVIDVGGPRHSGSIPAGQQGSEVALTPKSPAVAAPPSSAAWMDALPEAQPTPAMQMGKGAPSPESTPPSESPPQSTMQNLAGSAAAFVHGIPRGALGENTIDYGEAALRTPAAMLGGMQGPSAAFNEALGQIQGTNQQAEQHPIANTLGNVAGAVGGGLAAAPALGWGSAASTLGKLGQGASFIGRNAAFGAGMSALNNGDPRTGAVIGGVLPAALVTGSPFAGMASGAMQRLAPLFGQGGREASVGRTLARDVGSSPIQTSPVGPLNLAQATGSPNVAAQADIAPGYNAAAQAGLIGRQQQAIATQIGKIGTAQAPADAAANVTGQVRAGFGAIKDQERSLWNRPALQQTHVGTAPIKQQVGQALDALPHGLKPGVTGNVRAAVDQLNSMPDTASLSDLNSVSTMLRLASKPTESNPWAAAVGPKLHDAFMQAADNAAHAPGVDPAAYAAWSQARAFTKASHEFDGPKIKAIMKQGGKEPSAAGKAIFANPEGPKTLADLSGFLAGLPKGTQASNAIKESARDFLASRMQEEANRATGNKMLGEFIRKNSTALRNSGILDAPQIKALDELENYTDMLTSPTKLLAQVNSATQARQARAKTFVDEIISPGLIRLGALIGGGVSFAHGDVMGGLEHSLVGGYAGEQINHHIKAVTAIMQSLKAEAIFDPALAQALMTKASNANAALLSPRVRMILNDARAAITNVAANSLAPPTGQPRPSTQSIPLQQ